MISLISLYYLNRKNKIVRMSVDIGMDIKTAEKRTRNDEIILIVLVTIFILLFFATSLKVFITLLILGLVIGTFGLIKDYKERRRK